MQVRKPKESVVSLRGERVEGPILTVYQLEDKHPALHGRLRRYIMLADIGLSQYAGLKEAVIRVGRSVMLDEGRVLQWLESQSNRPQSRARNPHGRAGKSTSRAAPR